MRQPRLSLLFFALLGLTSSCALGFGERSIVGSGRIVQEERSVERIDSVELGLPADLRVSVGAPQVALSIRGDDNIVAAITTRVSGSELEIELPGSYKSKQRITIDLALPELVGVSIKGSGQVEIVEAQGAHLAVSIYGSGEVLAGGRIDQLEASIQGSGELDFSGLVARQAELSINGSGTAAVHVEEALSYSIHGSGHVDLRGDARVEGKISGSGSLERH